MPGRLIAFLLLLSPALAQTTTSFEVASLKPAAPCCAAGQDRVEYPIPKAGEDRVDFRHVSLRYCLQFAFGVEDYRLSGPPWLNEVFFDIEAKGPEGTRHAQLPAMVQTLLAVRFGLKMRREVKDMPALALVINGGGPKLKESAVGNDDAGPTFTQTMTYNGAGKMEVKRASMTEFAGFLSMLLRRPVVDMTGLNGRYDLDPAFSNEDTRGTTIVYFDSAPEESYSATSIFTSIKDFGLKLQSRRLPLEMIVVDHIEKTPTGN